MGVCSMGPGLRFVGGWKHWVRNAESTPLVSGCQVQSHEVGAGLSLLGTRGAVVRHLETLTISGAGSLGECCTLGTHGQVWRNSGLGPGGGGAHTGASGGGRSPEVACFPTHISLRARDRMCSPPCPLPAEGQDRRYESTAGYTNELATFPSGKHDAVKPSQPPTYFPKEGQGEVERTFLKGLGLETPSSMPGSGRTVSKPASLRRRGLGPRRGEE